MSSERILIVDDEFFFRTVLNEGLKDRYDVIEACNCEEGVAKAVEHQPDLIIMDVEMPVMDGITAVKQIMAEAPIPILMLSSYTSAGAKATLDALSAGAVDFIPKQSDGASQNVERLSTMLVQKVLAVARHPVMQPAAAPARRTAVRATPARPRESPRVVRRGNYDLVVIGASTGGPVAIQGLVNSLPRDFSVPMVLAVHMPGNFTKAFAERLNSMCALNVKEAVDGDKLQPGLALLAPGGKQLSFVRKGADTYVCIGDGDPGATYKPSIDITLESAARVLRESVLAVILTGMGSDGCEGASLLKQCNATVWSQDEASCVIYGMPQAVEKKGLSDVVLPLTEIGPALVKAV